MIRQAQAIRVILCSVLFITGCEKRIAEKQMSSENIDEEALSRKARKGLEIFRSKQFGAVPIACADCHADFDDTAKPDENRIRPGHSILGAQKRTIGWNGEFSGGMMKRTAAGAAKCASLYQKRAEEIGKALSEAEAEALMAYFEAISTGKEAAQLEWKAVTYPDDPNVNSDAFNDAIDNILALKGDAKKGESFFDKTCGLCHPHGDEGIGASLKKSKKNEKGIARLVRAGKENMPFFSTDKLTDQNVADIIRYVRDKIEK